MKSGIYNMDCMEAMKEFPDNFFSLAIVDPPYGIGNITITSGRKRKYVHKKVTWNNQIPSKKYFDELHRISINQIIWGCNYYFGMITVPGRIVHYKETDKHCGGLNLSPCDLASQSFDRRIEYYHYRWAGNVQGKRVNWKNDGPDARIHPTQKPISLYEWCLMKYANKGDKILDTHLGSGSCAVAAHKLGYQLWGFEIDKDYFEAIQKRIKIEKSKPTLFSNH